MSLDIASLHRQLDYDPATGIFRWKVVRRGSRNRPGGEAGTVRDPNTLNPYLVIWVDGVLYRAHRLAWFYVHGVWPTEGLDHVDGDGLNNRMANLRECNQQQNNGNHKRLCGHNTSGLRGVTWKKDRQKWKAYIVKNGRQHHLGYFDDKEAARAAFAAAAIEHFGEFARVA